MKLKMYFLVKGDEVFSGPHFTVDQAVSAKWNFHAPLRPILKVMRLDGVFNLVDV
jgi:hypothetical protein